MWQEGACRNPTPASQQSQARGTTYRFLLALLKFPLIVLLELCIGLSIALSVRLLPFSSEQFHDTVE
ncbi:MAG: hypothetical protein LZF62_180057 [Nitrospira sp.]|nr:MAG: hypothetical protein LZF62_180057 [Nitrospira sp.]